MLVRLRLIEKPKNRRPVRYLVLAGSVIAVGPSLPPSCRASTPPGRRPPRSRDSRRPTRWPRRSIPLPDSSPRTRLVSGDAGLGRRRTQRTTATSPISSLFGRYGRGSETCSASRGGDPRRDGLAGHYHDHRRDRSTRHDAARETGRVTDPRTAPGVERVCASRAGVTSGDRAHSDRAATHAGACSGGLLRPRPGVVVAIRRLQPSPHRECPSDFTTTRRSLAVRHCAGARQRRHCRRLRDPPGRELALGRPTRAGASDGLVRSGLQVRQPRRPRAQCSRNGLQVMITLWGTPRWANERRGPNVAPTRSKAFEDFSRAIADRYSGRHAGFPHVGRYSIWNEPNLEIFLTPQFDRGGAIVSPRSYARLYRAGHAGIKAGNPSALVAIGETSNQGRDRPVLEPRPTRSRPARSRASSRRSEVSRSMPTPHTRTRPARTHRRRNESAGRTSRSLSCRDSRNRSTGGSSVATSRSGLRSSGTRRNPVTDSE